MMFAWQGWKISLPAGWNPMKLDGNFDAGYALIADVHRPRLGMKWATPDQKFDALMWAKKALVEEVGVLAAGSAKSCQSEHWDGALLYHEPDPPGRDVWLAYSKVSGRTMELVHHVRAGEVSRMDRLRGELCDSSPSEELAWAVFDLSCRTPGGWRLESQLLNAGDLGLAFSKDHERLKVRQIAVAHLAIKRMPIAGWLDQQQVPYERNYRATENISVNLEPGGLSGVGCRLERRRGLWRRRLAAEIHIMALLDAKRDRLLLIESENQMSGEQLARTVGTVD